MRVIGTAGHVDHGKSTLVAALTGTHPDRLKEEQLREMTIDLGFAWMTLPNGEELGFVDVPGHRDFIENMLAGIGAIDAVLFIIAADEGVMPQTREHLAIIDLLKIPRGLIVLTKTDLAEREAGWLDLLEADVRATVSSTVLRDAPIVRVSARTRAGLDQLVDALMHLLDEEPPRADLERPRLPIDRVFTMSGFGTVVTGTLSDGTLSVGSEIEVLPSGKRGRVRGLQTHKKKEERARPGSRTAVNISGIEADSIQRGDVLVQPGQYQSTRRVDAKLQLLPNSSIALHHGDTLKFFIGASETIATVRLLGVEELLPGEQAWIQFELRDPIVAVRGDRYIVRRPSPAETLGGGVIVDAQAKERHKRFDAQVLASLSALLHGSPQDILLEAARALNIASAREIIARSRLEADAAQQALTEALSRRELVQLEAGTNSGADDALLATRTAWNALREQILRALDEYHAQYPVRGGMPREELKSRARVAPQIFNAALKKLAAEKALEDAAARVTRPGRTIKFEAAEQAKIQEMMRAFASNPYSTPSVKECQAALGDEVFHALVEAHELMPVSEDVVFRKSDYDSMVEQVRALIEQSGSVTLAQVRDLFGTTRKYAQALLEHLDSMGTTLRDGDVRRLRS